MEISDPLTLFMLIFAYGLLALVGVGWALAHFVPSLRKTMRVLAYVLVTLLVPSIFGVGYFLSFYPPITRSPHIFAQGETKNGKFMVAGTSEGFPDWDISLFWKPPGQPWAVYYLDCDGDGWDHYEMVEMGDHLLVKFPSNYNGLTADLNLKTCLMKRWTDQPDQPPLYLVQNSGPYSGYSSRIDDYSQNWSYVWAAFQKNVPLGK